MKTNTYIVILLLILASCHGNENRYDATGTFEATEILISAEASGRIMQFDIEEGMLLDAGTPVGYIDSIQLHLKKMQLIANKHAIEANKPDILKQIAATQQLIETALIERKRMENLVRAKSANQKQLDDIQENILFYRKQLEAQHSTLAKTTLSANKQIESLDYQVRQLDDQLAKCRLVNPVAGTVLAKYAQPNEITAAGRPLYKIADTRQLFLRVYVTAAQLTQLKIGQTVKITADFGEKDRREYPGAITWISDKSEFTPKGIQTKDERVNLVYAVKISLRNDGYLKIGQYGEAIFN